MIIQYVPKDYLSIIYLIHVLDNNGHDKTSNGQFQGDNDRKHPYSLELNSIKKDLICPDDNVCYWFLYINFHE